MLNLQEIFLKILDRNQWGLFHKLEPLEKLKVQESQDMYRINEVSIADFINEFNKAVKESLENKEE